MKSRKSLVVWNHQEDESKLEKIILSTGQVIVPTEEINSWDGLDSFLKKNHPTELTLWGKFCLFMNS